VISHYLSGQIRIDELKEADGLEKHLQWVSELKRKHGINLTEEEAEKVIEVEIAGKFSQVLEDAGVYKNNPIGYKGFERFLAAAGIEKVEL
jgi:UDPglucose--hexose-1-phosphate uridylyltransferase